MLPLRWIISKMNTKSKIFRDCKNYSFTSQRNHAHSLGKFLVSKNTSAKVNLVVITQQQTRSKYTRKSSRSNNEEEDSDEDERREEYKDERDSKVVKTGVNSLRADLILKAGLNLARNKVEVLFYESKIRVNGKKIPKKSVQLNVGDEIDAIKGFSSMNPNFLLIGRVVILSATKKDDGTLSVYLRRYKSLTIENYVGQDTFRTSES